MENQLTWTEEWSLANAKKIKTQTLVELLWREKKRVRALILASECIMRTLAALGALAPYGPAFRPN